MFKRFFSIAAALVLSISGLSIAQPAQAAWPEKPVKFLLGSGAGTSIDMVGRVIAQKLSEKFNQPFVPQNIPGGGLGAFTMTLKNAKGDGYTIGLGADTFFTFNSLDPKAKFKMDDFKFVCAVFQGDCGYVTTPDKPWKNLKEALEYSKTSEKPLNYLFQTAQDRKIMEEYVKQVPGARVNIIPSQSPAATLTSLIGGHADFGFCGGNQYEQDRAGKLRTFTMTTSKRTLHYPDVPTVSECMTAPFITDAYRIIVVPKSFPDDILQTLSAELEKIVTSQEFKETVDSKLHFIPSYLNSAELTKILQQCLEDNKQFWK